MKLVESGQLKKAGVKEVLGNEAIQKLFSKVPGEYWGSKDRGAYAEQFTKSLEGILQKKGWLDGRLSPEAARTVLDAAARSHSKGVEIGKGLDLSRSGNPYNRAVNPVLHDAFEAAFRGQQETNSSYRILQKLAKAGIDGHLRVFEGLLTGGKARIGAEFQLEVAEYYLDRGNLQAVEVRIGSKRIDILTKDGFAIELKNYGTGEGSMWSRANAEDRGKLIKDIETQAGNYLEKTGYKLRLWFSNKLLGLEGYIEPVKTRLNGRFPGRFEWGAGWPPEPPKPLSFPEMGGHGEGI